ncbi:hypothetical protein LX32DRAFT_276586 [Colletotrichum zoysiae]|uniref:Uncharacterized protein n=1 Tax=Colletotrichum zoysiae TaxID=1216348 RepID=A0AAD9HNR1_9PEZI|nr:hypothetical protein LX32DRAFT_276586 [Colletotrichum zoysiae]
MLLAGRPAARCSLSWLPVSLGVGTYGHLLNPGKQALPHCTYALQFLLPSFFFPVVPGKPMQPVPPLLARFMVFPELVRLFPSPNMTGAQSTGCSSRLLS